MAQMDAYHHAAQVVERLEVTLDQVFHKKRELHELVGIIFDGVANSAGESELGENMTTAMDNLENVAVQKNNIVERLVIANKALTDSLTAC